jgi:hypothetical protein
MEVSDGQLHATVALLQGKEPPVPIEQEAGWAPEPVWTQRWRRQKKFGPCLDLNPGLPTRSLVAIRTKLPRLRSGIIYKINFIKIVSFF